MEISNHIDLAERVHYYYWNANLNCATTTLKILAEAFGITLYKQVLSAASGMQGAGQYGAQCGLVEGPLMFIGVVGRTKGIDDNAISQACRSYAAAFEQNFGSLLCRDLRPEGFRPGLPPHLCESLTVEAGQFALASLPRFLSIL